MCRWRMGRRCGFVLFQRLTEGSRPIALDDWDEAHFTSAKYSGLYPSISLSLYFTGVTGVTPFLRMMFPYFAVSPVATTAKPWVFTRS